MSKAHTIDIFTDGGVFEEGKYSISTGIVNMDGEKLTTIKYISYNKTCTFAEIIAVKKSLSRLYGCIKQKGIDVKNCKVTIYSDSAMVVNALQNIIKYRYIKTDIHGNEIFHEIEELFYKLGCLSISVYHINSHIGSSKIGTYHKKFCEYNNIDIDYNSFKYVREQNSVCDQMVKQIYQSKFAN